MLTSRVLFNSNELRLTRPTECPVKRVIFIASQYDVLRIRGAAEEFNAIVRVIVHLNIVNDGSGTRALKRNTV